MSENLTRLQAVSARREEYCLGARVSGTPFYFCLTDRCNGPEFQGRNLNMRRVDLAVALGALTHVSAAPAVRAQHSDRISLIARKIHLIATPPGRTGTNTNFELRLPGLLPCSRALSKMRKKPLRPSRLVMLTPRSIICRPLRINPKDERPYLWAGHSLRRSEKAKEAIQLSESHRD